MKMFALKGDKNVSENNILKYNYKYDGDQRIKFHCEEC